MPGIFYTRDILHHGYNFRVEHSIPGIEHSIPGIQHSIPGIEHSIPGMKHSIPEIELPGIPIYSIFINIIHCLLSVNFASHI